MADFHRVTFFSFGRRSCYCNYPGKVIASILHTGKKPSLTIPPSTVLVIKHIICFFSHDFRLIKTKLCFNRCKVKPLPFSQTNQLSLASFLANSGDFQQTHSSPASSIIPQLGLYFLLSVLVSLDSVFGSLFFYFSSLLSHFRFIL